MKASAATRSEEHTSELQSLRHLVCRLLLEKKFEFRQGEKPNHKVDCTVEYGLCCAANRVHAHPLSRCAQAAMPLLAPDCFFFNDTATTEIYTLSLHDALPISFGELVRRRTALENAKSALIVDEKTDRKSTRLNSSHLGISYAVFCLKKKK